MGRVGWGRNIYKPPQVLCVDLCRGLLFIRVERSYPSIPLTLHSDPSDPSIPSQIQPLNTLNTLNPPNDPPTWTAIKIPTTKGTLTKTVLHPGFRVLPKWQMGAKCVVNWSIRIHGEREVLTPKPKPNPDPTPN